MRCLYGLVTAQKQTEIGWNFHRPFDTALIPEERMTNKAGILAVFFSHWFLAVPAVILCVVATCTWPMAGRANPDLGLYYHCAEKISSGAMPYRDFQVEYPPLALIPCLVPWFVSGGRTDSDSYRHLFLAGSAFYLTIISITVVAIARKMEFSTRHCICFLALYAGATAPLIPWRYDLFPAMLTGLALLAIARRHPLSGGVLLGLGIVAKLYPIVLLPVIAAYYLAKREWRPLCLLGAGCAGAVFCTSLPFFLPGEKGLMAFFAYHQHRGIQIESMTGGLFMLICVLQHGTAPLGLSYGAWHLHSPGANLLAPLHSVLFVAVYALFLALAWSRFRTDQRDFASAFRTLLQFCAGALLVFMLTNKVLSPQYLAWLFPFAVFFPRRQAVWFVVICAISMAVAPFWYESLLRCNLWVVVLLNVRNAMLLVMLFWICQPLPLPIRSAP